MEKDAVKLKNDPRDTKLLAAISMSRAGHLSHHDLLEAVLQWPPVLQMIRSKLG